MSLHKKHDEPRCELELSEIEYMNNLLNRQEFFELEDMAIRKIRKMIISDKQFVLTTKARKIIDETSR